ncbi:MAG TPA: flavodoxin family protein [Candidatus Hydrogenedentes bacterium]|nr:flavodoxin family protein [Candidatus Hydrogenedentota bacterium]
MKIVAVLGSPRLNGNSAYIAERFLETARNLGAETQSFALNTLTYRGCQACRACKKTSEVCVLQDDLTEVLEAVRNAEAIVFASPVYFADVSGQMKLFIDRTYCFLTPDFHSNPNGSRLLPGKTAIFILTQGFPETVFADVFPRYQGVMRFIGINKTYLIRGCNLAKPDDILKHEDLLKQTEALAVHIMSRNAQPC